MALKIRIKPGQDNDRLLKNLTQPKLAKAKERAIELFGLVLKRALTEKTFELTKSRTGTLARSWKVTPRKSSLQISNRARSRTSPGGTKGKPYGAFIEFGTKAHRVEPRNAKALRWRTGGRGPISAFGATKAGSKKNFAFSKGHRVRGIKARRIVPKTINAVGGMLRKLMNSEFEKALGK